MHNNIIIIVDIATNITFILITMKTLVINTSNSQT